MQVGKYRRIVILTGAGISAESGIDTFRDKGGIWERVDLEQVATPDAFARNPGYVHEFHNDFRLSLAAIQPNAAHLALAELEAGHSGEVLVVTQNVDDLHEKAGSRNVIHMHGELYKIRCQRCGVIAHWQETLSSETPCPTCGEREALRPHVVWFYEIPFEMDRIQAALAACDLFLSIGTSGQVYPAAGFVADVRRRGSARTVELNLEPSDGANLFHDCIHGPAGDVVPRFVAGLLGKYSEDGRYG